MVLQRPCECVLCVYVGVVCWCGCACEPLSDCEIVCWCVYEVACVCVGLVACLIDWLPGGLGCCRGVQPWQPYPGSTPKSST
jgi:hypothetical protein